MMLFQYVTKLTLAVSRSNVQRKYPSGQDWVILCWRRHKTASWFLPASEQGSVYKCRGLGPAQANPWSCRTVTQAWGQPTVRSGCCPQRGSTVYLDWGVDTHTLRAQAPHPMSKWDVKSRPLSKYSPVTIPNVQPTPEPPGSWLSNLLGPLFQSSTVHWFWDLTLKPTLLQNLPWSALPAAPFNLSFQPLPLPIVSDD